MVKQIWWIFTHLKLWVAVASHNFKWVKNKFKNLAGEGLSIVLAADTLI